MKDYVSIIIPCYNNEKYVGEAIESALGQTYTPTEVIVIDDGSTDDSLEVIRSFGKEVTWRTGENKGVSAARNKGLRLASGKFVKFLDADDLLPEEAIATQVQQAKKIEENEAIVFGDSRQVNQSGNIQGRSSFRSLRESEDPISYILTVNPGVSFPLHRREHLCEIGGFDEELPWAEDYDLHLRLHLAGFLLRYRPGVVVVVREHDGEDRLTNRKQREFEQDPFSFYRRVRNREQKIREGRRGELSESVRQHLAKGFWTGGRQALKAGHPKIAKRYFSHAWELHSQPMATSSAIYRWCVKLLGPQIAERLVERVRACYSRGSA